MRNLIFTTAFMMLGLYASAQSTKATLLRRIGKGDTLKPGAAVIYGSFIRRPGVAYGDFQHFIRIRNVETKETFLLEVKPYEIIPAKETSFYHYIKPGMYEIIGYEYTKTTLIGYKIFYAPVFRNVDYNSNIKTKLDSAMLQRPGLVPFMFKIENDGIYYLGKWNFSTGVVSFSNDKSALDEKSPAKFHLLNFESANLAIPY